MTELETLLKDFNAGRGGNAFEVIRKAYTLGQSEARKQTLEEVKEVIRKHFADVVTPIAPVLTDRILLTAIDNLHEAGERTKV